jgi:sulfate/thiosulfate transport system permease protein
MVEMSRLPGRNINLAYSLLYLSFIVILPLSILVLAIRHVSFHEIVEVLSSGRALAAFRLSFSLSILASLISGVLGLIIAWVLVEYDFFGKKFFDSIVDLPFAMPTAVSGIALATLYSEQGWLGRLGLNFSYTPVGILIALVFIGLPFVVRAVQPAIHVLDREMEEAAISLGASRITVLKKVIFPQLFPSLMTGFIMSLARALGEYGSVIFIAGNIPYVSEILPLLIVIELEQFDYNATIVLAVAMLLASFLLLALLGVVGNQIRKRYS